MGLSEEEENLLRAIERSLSEEDSNFVNSLRGVKKHNSGFKIAGIGLGIAGLSLLVIAVMLNITLVGVLGFILMLSAAALFIKISSHKGETLHDLTLLKGHDTETAPPSGMMGKLENRWKERQKKNQDDY